MPGVYLYGWDADAEEWVKLVCNAAGKLIIDPSEIFEDPPTDGEAGKAPTSNWAYDHKADAAAHHARYTDAESRAAINNIFGSDGKADKEINIDNHDLIKIWTLALSAQPSGVVYGYMFYNSIDLAFKLYGKNSSGFIVGVKIWVYNGSAYETLATEVIVDSKIATHAAIAAAHHTRYTDAEAVAAFGNRVNILTFGTYTNYGVGVYNMLILDTLDGDITLKGLSEGASKQMIFCFKLLSDNDVHIIHDSPDAAVGNRIYTASGADESIAAGHYGSFWLVFYNNYWRVDHALT